MQSFSTISNIPSFTLSRPLRWQITNEAWEYREKALIKSRATRKSPIARFVPCVRDLPPMQDKLKQKKNTSDVDSLKTVISSSKHHSSHTLCYYCLTLVGYFSPLFSSRSYLVKLTFQLIGTGRIITAPQITS